MPWRYKGGNWFGQAMASREVGVRHIDDVLGTYGGAGFRSLLMATAKIDKPNKDKGDFSKASDRLRRLARTLAFFNGPILN